MSVCTLGFLALSHFTSTSRYQLFLSPTILVESVKDDGFRLAGMFASQVPRVCTRTLHNILVQLNEKNLGFSLLVVLNGIYNSNSLINKCNNLEA